MMDFLTSPMVLILPIVFLVFWYIPKLFKEAGVHQAELHGARERALATLVTSKSLLTPNEQEFFGRLKRALSDDGYQVVPQVAMGALLDVALPQNHPLYWEVRRSFSQKICDFVILKPRTAEVVAIVELDDRTHDAQKDAKRDALMAQAGFTTVRWDSRAKPSVEAIREKVKSLGQELALH